MKTMKQRILLMATVAALALPVSLATAATVQLHGKALFRTAITLSATDMDFSKVDYSATPSAITDWVKLGTNDSIAANGVLSIGGGNVPLSGTVTITAGQTGETVGVKCDDGVGGNVRLANAGGKTIDIVSTEVKDTDEGTGAFGTGHACHGVAGADATTKVLDGTDVFKFGGEILGSTESGSGGFGGQYDTSNAGGSNLQVDIVYH